jgi:hypothetical protein
MRERVQWYAARWAAMEPGEVSHRCMEFLKKTAWRFDRRAWRHFDAGNGPLADFADLRSRLAAAFEVSSSEGLAAYSQGVQAGRLKLLGVSWPAHWAEGFAQGELPPRFWFQDPVSGQCWPGAEQYCFAIGYRHARRAPGDIKVIWELNRLQFLHPLAAEIAARSRSDLARWSLRLIQSWAEANPPFRGINWCSGIELALRLVSILLLVSAIGPHGLMPAERTLLRRLIWAHAYWLARYPSRYSSANNHLLAEGLGLYIAGRLVPDLPGAPMWRAMGARTMQQ